MRQKPKLSIGIIFKNEERCLERCLQSLQPIRNAIPCELVMADTGSTDGSREIAARYADILFDFPWINDFAAARNAVMDRCSGDWFLTVDCDEWFDGELISLEKFVTKHNRYAFGGIVIRNLKVSVGSEQIEYSDFFANRMVRMSTGIRYEGAIHEHWNTNTGSEYVMNVLGDCVFLHDGYLYDTPEKKEKKRRRNMELLKKELEHDPENLLTLTQCMDSSQGTEESEEYARRGVELIRARKPKWQMLGPVVFRDAVLTAVNREMPEFESWIAEAREQFPDSIYTRVDIGYNYAYLAYRDDNYEEFLERVGCYFQAVNDYKNKRFDINEMLRGGLYLHDPAWQARMCILAAECHARLGRTTLAVQLLMTLDGGMFNEYRIREFVRTCLYIHSYSTEDTQALITKIWDDIQIDREPGSEMACRRQGIFVHEAQKVFAKQHIEQELQTEKILRPGYTLFLPLRGKCEVGDKAAIYACTDPVEMKEHIAAAEDLNQLPHQLLSRALKNGINIPALRGMTMEETEAFAYKLAKGDPAFREILKRYTEDSDLEALQPLCWARALVLAAVNTNPWQDAEYSKWLARCFAEVEQRFVARYYGAELQEEENLHLLPPMHRFGWYCWRAFGELDNNNTVEFVHLLRRGLDSCNNMKKMVKFLVEHTEELKPAVEVTPEMLALAEQVKTVLAMYPADDPAVVALKATPAYQQVAFLIEE